MPLEEAINYTPTLGRYNETTFSRDSDLANLDGFLYFITIKTKNGVLHKIGITKRNVYARFPNKKNIKVIFLIKGRLESVYTLEQSLLEIFSDNLYRADKGFDGRTETLILTEEEEKVLVEILENEAKGTRFEIIDSENSQ